MARRLFVAPAHVHVHVAVHENVDDVLTCYEVCARWVKCQVI